MQNGLWRVRRGDLTTPMFMWFVGIIVAIVLVTWFIKASGFNEIDISSVDEDMKNIHYELSLTCTYSELESSVRVYTKQGKIIFNESSLCVFRPFSKGNITRCLVTPCDIPGSGEAEITSNGVIWINKTTSADGTTRLIMEGR